MATNREVLTKMICLVKDNSANISIKLLSNDGKTDGQMDGRST